MRAIILAGGKGKRLVPYTTVFPKPLMPIGNMPILEVVLKQLKKNGFTNITLAVGHLAQLIQAFFNNGSKLGLNITYSTENTPLGTAGPLALIDNLDETFLVMNGDILSDINHSELMDYHKRNKGIATIATYNRDIKIDLGVIETDRANNVCAYIEKPTLKYRVSMGIYVFEPNILNYIDKNQYLDFPDLVKHLMADGKIVRTYPFDGYWLDIGRPDDYERAIEEFQNKQSLFLG